jgi:hypothetical protein
MTHARMTFSGLLRSESDTTHFMRQASEERTAALHARDAKTREVHLAKADHFEDCVRAIARASSI